MKFTTKLIAVMALALIATGARAEEQVGYPVQYQIEARTIHATHTLHNIVRGVAVAEAEESIAPAILFPNASDKLTASAVASVKKVAALLKSPAYKGQKIQISGYTDSKGKDASNQRLSYHRAVAVVKQLVKDGVPASQLTAQGYGKENPVGDNATAEGRALNRRVTFTLAK